MTEDEMYDIIRGYEDSERDYHEHNIELEAENAKLRERVSELEELTDHRHYIPQEWYVALQTENAKLREAVATAIKVQTVLCGDADSLYCRNKCPLHRPESNDCLACDVIGVAQELGVEMTR